MQNELLHGTLEVMILKTLSWGPMHGYGIGRWIEQLSEVDTADVPPMTSVAAMRLAWRADHVSDAV